MPLPLLAPPPTPAPKPSCLRASDLCSLIYHHTNSSWLASSSYWLIVKPFRIVMIIVIALVIRYIVNRAIRRLIRRTAYGAAAKAAVAAEAAAVESEAEGESPPEPVGSGTQGGTHYLRAATQLPSALKPIQTAIDANIFPERRQQRAEAIGSVLQSFASAAIFTVALLMILSELDIQLAPLLASAGIAGIALGFGAQTLVKDLIAGLFMLLEDQYGVGDAVDVGEASGIVESVGLRITSIRDARGVLWHVRNGEIVRVGNKSQGWSVGVIDVPVGFAKVEDATEILQRAGQAFAEDPDWADDLIDPPTVLGVERVSVDGAVLRVTVKTTIEAQPRVGRELRTRLTAALGEAGILDALTSGRVYVRNNADDDSTGGSTTPAPPI
ncbi:MAG TPA: mechanosensitive ion channel family protein [Micromonosporaceae bacterium]|jgi:small conductance mechanosensitive channel